MAELSVRDAVHDDDVGGWLRRSWGATRVVAHGRVFEADELPAYVVTDGAGRPLGLVTYELGPDHLELVTIDSDAPGRGVGRLLLAEAVRRAATAGVARVVLTTTNDNLRALRFYQRSGFRLVALRPCAVAEARRLKPGIPEIGRDGIPIRDELDLELLVDGTDPPPS